MDDAPTINEDEAAKQADLENRIKAPIVWAKDELLGLRYEDLQDNRIDEALQLLKEHYLTEAVLYRTLNILEEPDSVSEFMQNARLWMKDKMSICAVDENTGDIAGVMIMRVQERVAFSRTFSKVKITRHLKYSKIMSFCNVVEKPVNVHEEFDTKTYLKIYLVAVAPNFRHKGVGINMIKHSMSSAKLCKIPVLVGMFTTGRFQATAAELGFQKINEVYYLKYLKDDLIVFHNTGVGNHGAALMGIKIDLFKEKAQKLNDYKNK